MISALVAEFFELKTIRLLLFVLGRKIVAILALRTLKNNVISWHNPSTSEPELYQQTRCLASRLEVPFGESPDKR